MSHLSHYEKESNIKHGLYYSPSLIYRGTELSNHCVHEKELFHIPFVYLETLGSPSLL